ncbi:MAG: hypothetical protein MKZ93_06490 [Prochlorococcus sp. ALOHA_A2.0_51]|nr:hypothetical protein [Prochlorococcus sp. ALOHA_A2.0_51]
MIQAGNHLKSHLDPLHWVEPEQIPTGLKNILKNEGKAYLDKVNLKKSQLINTRGTNPGKG